MCSLGMGARRGELPARVASRCEVMPLGCSVRVYVMGSAFLDMLYSLGVAAMAANR